MKHHRLDTHGSANPFLIGFILTSVLLLGTAAFGLWAYAGRQDYKENADEKIKKAVQVAVIEAETTKDNEFAEKEKDPLKEYSGPSTLGSLVLKYPKTWSVYFAEDGSDNSGINAFFHPNYVPPDRNKVTYAFRLRVANRTYEQSLGEFESKVKTGKTKASAFKPKNVPSVLGSRLDGEIIDQKKGSMVLLPLRDKTIVLWTESDQFVSDFDTHVLPSIIFSP